MTNPPIDIAALRNTYGEESTAELLDLSLQEGEKLIAELHSSVAKKDAEKTAVDAHQLKGMALTMTIFGMSELAKQLELKAKAGDWAEAPEILAKISTSMAELRRFLAEAGLMP